MAAVSSPFPVSSAAPGAGRIVVGVLPSGEPSIQLLSFQYPLKLIAPSSGAGVGRSFNLGSKAGAAAEKLGADVVADRKSALVFLLSYGGGLVAGDQVNLAIDVRSAARLSIVTQGTTKVFKAPSVKNTLPAITRQNLDIRVAAKGAICLLPDPVQPFADSVYEQVQVVRMEEGASLCLLDWVTQGRAARGENWSFTHWQGRNEVWADEGNWGFSSPDSTYANIPPRLLVRDAVLLAPELLHGSGDCPSMAASSSSSSPLRISMHGLAVVGTLILRGPLVDALAAFFLVEFALQPRLGARDFRDGPEQRLESSEALLEGVDVSWRSRRLNLEKMHGVLWSAAAVRGCTVVKFGARTVEGGRLWIGSMLEHERSIASVFGQQALMCVR